ncbi:unnamed protein product [Sphenostylis stenocarpa]|uniref:BHLH domain-containing protein n=1 Tax=Sphenostylis stenocarpa TaxID=92480 RepID=A0AA86VKU4_9FABA|nr:unnamed protein product [Sphenostylis stenocarpa]
MQDHVKDVMGPGVPILAWEMEDEVVDECLCHTNHFDEEFLRDILQQPQEALVAAPDLNTFGETSFPGGGNFMMKNSNSYSSIMNKPTSSPTTYVLSFDKSAEPHPWKDVSHDQLPLSTARTNQGTKKTRSASESMDHIISERNRRQDLTRKFIALASTIPGLKKMDKAHVLREAINYVKQLQERVEVLEEDIQKNGVESAITISRSHLCIDDTNSDECNGSNEAVPPEVEARVLGKQVLIKIHCGKQKGILLKIMSQLERLHLFISTSNVLPLGITLDITIIAQMGDKYNMVVQDLVKELRRVVLKVSYLRGTGERYNVLNREGLIEAGKNEEKGCWNNERSDELDGGVAEWPCTRGRCWEALHDMMHWVAKEPLLSTWNASKSSSLPLRYSSSTPPTLPFLPSFKIFTPVLLTKQPPRPQNIVTGSPTSTQLPFEFGVLEACIESACRCLESDNAELDNSRGNHLFMGIPFANFAKPHKCSTTQIESRLVCEGLQVADELENLLDDNNDMADMYLTQKLNDRLFDQTSLKEGYNSEVEDIDER